MADERGPDELGDLWRNQPAMPANMSIDELRHKAQRFEVKIRLWFYMATGLLIFLAAGYGSFLYFFPGILQRIGSTLAVAGFLFGAYQLYRRGPARRVPAGPVPATSAAYRAELERQRDFCASMWSLLLAFVPGPVLFIMGFAAADLGPAKATGLTLVLALTPFLVGIPLNLREARKLQQEIDVLDELQGGLSCADRRP